jgi:hypothetical protein
MACYVEVIDIGVMRVTIIGKKPLKNPKKPTASDEKEIHLNARARNYCLLNALALECSIKFINSIRQMKFG